MNPITKLFKHMSHYFVAEILVMISGIISFPIFTRILSKSEYGIMAIVTATLTLCNILASGGLRPSVVKFYGEYKYKEGNVDLLYSTLFVSTCFFGVIFAILIFLAGYVIPGAILSSQISQLFGFVAGLIFFNVIIKLVLSILKAEEKTLLYGTIFVVNKYLGLGLSIVFVVFLSMRLQGIYSGLLLSDALFAIILMFYVAKRLKAKILKFSKDVFWEVFKYGVPLLLLNVSAFFNNMGDRYLIQLFLGSEKVAVYSVGYNMSSYVQALLLNTMTMAFWPICMNLWSQKGVEETEKFLKKVMLIYIVVACPIIFGTSALGSELIVLMASSKYAGTHTLIPFIISGIMIGGLHLSVTAGLYIYKKTVLISLLLLFSATINIALNYLLIPKIGIIGAALATLVSNVIYLVTGRQYSKKYLNIKIDYLAILKYSIMSYIMYLLLINLKLYAYSKLVTMILFIAFGVAAYSILLFIFDRKSRNTFYILSSKFLMSLKMKEA